MNLPIVDSTAVTAANKREENLQKAYLISVNKKANKLLENLM